MHAPHGGDIATLGTVAELTSTELAWFDDARVINSESVLLSCFALTHEWKFPGKRKPKSLGAAAQTLAMLYGTANLNDKSFCFPFVTTMAEKLYLGERTIHYHLDDLEALKLIQHRGRERPARSRMKRRAVTYAVSRLVGDFYKSHKYIQLPLFICKVLERWSERLLFAAVFDREVMRTNITFGGIRDEFGMAELMSITGLSRRSLIDAKHYLQGQGIISVWEDDTDWHTPSTITLNTDCMVVMKGDKPTGLRRVKR